MELVNTLGNTFNRNNVYSATDPSTFASSSEALGSGVKSASDVSGAILDIFKCSLLEAESYLMTFEAKLKLEEDYVKGLRVLSDKSKDSLIKLDGYVLVRILSFFIIPMNVYLEEKEKADLFCSICTLK